MSTALPSAPLIVAEIHTVENPFVGNEISLVVVHLGARGVYVVITAGIVGQIAFGRGSFGKSYEDV